LRWSRDGTYLLAASPGGAFRLWETERWGNAAWGAGPGGDLVGACWHPDGRCVLLAFAESQGLMSLHLVGSRLDAQLLPVDLPDFHSQKAVPGLGPFPPSSPDYPVPEQTAFAIAVLSTQRFFNALPLMFERV